MSEAEKAFETWLDTHPRKGRGAEWLAACAWQRERDAQIVKETAGRVIDDALNSDPNPWPDPNSDDEVGIMVSVIVDAIRKQDAPVCQTCHGSGKVWVVEALDIESALTMLDGGPQGEPKAETCPDCIAAEIRKQDAP